MPLQPSMAQTCDDGPAALAETRAQLSSATGGSTRSWSRTAFRRTVRGVIAEQLETT
jgi:hypothetical protein